MEFVSVSDFKAHASRLMKSGKPVVVLRNSKPAGMFIPWEDLKTDEINEEFRRMALLSVTDKIIAEREAVSLTEEEILDDFASFRHDRRGRQRHVVGDHRG